MQVEAIAEQLKPVIHQLVVDAFREATTPTTVRRFMRAAMKAAEKEVEDKRAAGQRIEFQKTLMKKLRYQRINSITDPKQKAAELAQQRCYEAREAGRKVDFAKELKKARKECGVS